MSNQHDEQPALDRLSQSPAEPGQFDIIKACEGYLASFEAQHPEEASHSYLHGWRMGRLGQNRYELTRKADRV